MKKIYQTTICFIVSIILILIPVFPTSKQQKDLVHITLPTVTTASILPATMVECVQPTVQKNLQFTTDDELISYFLYNNNNNFYHKPTLEVRASMEIKSDAIVESNKPVVKVPEATPSITQKSVEKTVEDNCIPKTTQYTTYKVTEKELIVLAKIVYREARGVKHTREKAAVIWTILNRVDSDQPIFPDDIISVATQPHQFAWEPDTPVWDELYDLAVDVTDRWIREKNGETDVGRVLPKDYLFFASHGDTLLDSAIQMLVLCIYVNSYFLIIVFHDGYCGSCI